MMQSIDPSLTDLAAADPVFLRSAFQAFDVSQTGSITAKDFCDCVASVTNIRLSEQITRELIQAFDIDGDGSIDYEEFCNIFHHGDTEDDKQMQQDDVAPTSTPDTKMRNAEQELTRTDTEAARILSELRDIEKACVNLKKRLKTCKVQPP